MAKETTIERERESKTAMSAHLAKVKCNSRKTLLWTHSHTKQEEKRKREP